LGARFFFPCNAHPTFFRVLPRPLMLAALRRQGRGCQGCVRQADRCHRRQVNGERSLASGMGAWSREGALSTEGSSARRFGLRGGFFFGCGGRLWGTLSGVICVGGGRAVPLHPRHRPWRQPLPTPARHPLSSTPTVSFVCVCVALPRTPGTFVCATVRSVAVNVKKPKHVQESRCTRGWKCGASTVIHTRTLASRTARSGKRPQSQALEGDAREGQALLPF
jgi:hypothetical protein